MRIKRDVVKANYRMKNHLLKLMDKLVQKHPKGGTSYFNELDDNIKNNELTYIICAFITYNFRKNGYTILGTGEFGKILKEKAIVDYVFEGGLRKYKKNISLPDNFKSNENSKYLLIDDSYYSGNTANSIFDAIDAKERIIRCMYDGSKIKNKNVMSLIRYYDYY